jgi:glyoxalase family protein
MMHIKGIHHISMIVHSPQTTVDFYHGILQLDFIKQTINFDDPYTYHLYFGRHENPIGSLLTFFPWLGGRKGRDGAGQIYCIQLSIPKGTKDYWKDRLKTFNVKTNDFNNQDLKGVSFNDPDGIAYEMVESNSLDNKPSIKGIYGVKMYSSNLIETVKVFNDILDFEIITLNKDYARLSNNNYSIEITSHDQKGAYGVGTVHHIAYTLNHDALMNPMIEAIKSINLEPTSIKDRYYFKSVYFKELGGNIFELATTLPGFTTDEPIDKLGKELKIPPLHDAIKQSIRNRLISLRIGDNSED